MKALIWIACFLPACIINSFISFSGPLFSDPAIKGICVALLFGAAFWLARKLCEKWEDRNQEY